MADVSPSDKAGKEMSANVGYPHRKALPHSVPCWVKPGSLYFVTLCGVPRGQNQFCHPQIAASIFESIAHRHVRDDWYVRLAVLMPDHAHMLVAFPRTVAMKAIVTQWKGYLARNFGLRWQRDFFEHRLRQAESLQDKAHYIRMNPVRAGFVSTPEEWAYVWEPERLRAS